MINSTLGRMSRRWADAAMPARHAISLFRMLLRAERQSSFCPVNLLLAVRRQSFPQVHFGSVDRQAS